MAINGIYNHYIIDMSSNNNFVQIPTMQGDGNGVRGFEIELIENGIQYIVNPNVSVVSIMGSKPDTKHIINECTVSSEGYILVDITSQMSAVNGRGDYCIVLMDKDTNSQLKSFPFYIMTTSAPYNISGIISSDEFQLLTKRITQVEDIVFEGNEIIEDLTAFGNTAKANETARVNAENQRKTAESQRIVNETNRINTEIIRKENEDARIIAENVRVDNENIRISSENKRIDNENERINAENERKSAEIIRDESEQERINAEEIRIANENIRIANEKTRNEAEDIRQENEENRKTAFDELMETANSEVERLQQENDTASASATAAALSEINSKNAETVSTQMADLSKSYAVGTDGTIRSDDATDNSKYYYELAKAHALASGGIIFMGTKTFAELSLEENQVTNYLFNISEEFVTDKTFNVGEGIKYSLGTNVCRTADGFWDVFCGIESFTTGEIVTASINDEPANQKEGDYWIFSY